MKQKMMLVTALIFSTFLFYTVIKAEDVPSNKQPEIQKFRLESIKPARLPKEFEGCKKEDPPKNPTFLSAKDMKVGTFAWSPSNTIDVDQNGYCYLWTSCTVWRSGDFDAKEIKVERRADGYYIYVKSGKVCWDRGSISNTVLYDGLKYGYIVPVKGIIVHISGTGTSKGLFN